MADMMLRFPPFQLSRGLYLEKAKCLLPGDASRETLATLAGPMPADIPGPRRADFGWKDESIFDGFEVDIWYEEASGRLRINPKNLDQSAPREAFIFYRDLLTPKLGEPRLAPYEDWGIEYPRAVWQFGNIEVSLTVGERFLEYLVMYVKRGDGIR
jgi:hypothetical protein